MRESSDAQGKFHGQANQASLNKDFFLAGIVFRNFWTDGLLVFLFYGWRQLAKYD